MKCMPLDSLRCTPVARDDTFATAWNACKDARTTVGEKAGVTMDVTPF